MTRCPCCRGEVPSGNYGERKSWRQLCQPCGTFAFRLSACPHLLAAERRETERAA